MLRDTIVLSCKENQRLIYWEGEREEKYNNEKKQIVSLR